MNRFIVFLRGVNVGGNARIGMTTLKEALIKEGFKNVITYLNSGNLYLQSAVDKDETAGVIGQIIRTQFGLNIGMIIKTPKGLVNILNNAPFNPETETDNSKKMIVMLSDKVDDDCISVFRTDIQIEEHYSLIGDMLYIYYHNGAGRTKFTNAYIEKKLGVTATSRNWNTIAKMVEITR